MYSLPSGGLIPGPVMMSMAFSITGAATADTEAELRKALKKVAEAVRAVRESMKAAPPLTFDGNPNDASPESAEQLRAALDGALAIEISLSRLRQDIASLVRRKKFRETLNVPSLPFSIGDFRKFVSDLSSEYIPTLRKMRLALILEVARRSLRAGLHIIVPSEEFKREFLTATLKETEAWQETAFILANTEGAMRLNASIQADSHDRTEFIGKMMH